MPRRVSEKIEVKVEGETRWKQPASFVWRGEEFKIKKIRSRREDHNVGMLPPSRRRWWESRGRTYYVVETEGGGVYEIYQDQASRNKEWFFSREIRPKPLRK